jgi:hypothetical protein
MPLMSEVFRHTRYVKLSRTLAVVVVVAASATGLSACAPAVKTPHHAAASSPSTPTPKPIVQPVSRYPAGCDDLFPAASLAPLFAHTLAAVDAPAVDHSLGLWPGGYATRALGGLTCRWTDGESASLSTAESIDLEARPVSAAVWSQQLNEMDPSDRTSPTTSIGCNGISSDNLANFCTYEAYVNGSWIVASFMAMKANPGQLTSVLPAPLSALISSAEAKLTPIAAASSPPTASITLPATSTWMLTPAQLQSAFGTTVSVTPECDTSGDGGVTFDEEAMVELIGAIGCMLNHHASTDNANYGELSWLPGGEWAAKQAVAATPGETRVEIAGLSAGDQAWSVTIDHGASELDLIIGGNWFEISLVGPDQAGGEPADAAKAAPAAALAAIATDISANIRG